MWISLISGGRASQLGFRGDRSKVIQMDRRGHAMSGMDAVYLHITPEMRQFLCSILEKFWDQAVAQ